MSAACCGLYLFLRLHAVPICNENRVLAKIRRRPFGFSVLYFRKRNQGKCNICFNRLSESIIQRRLSTDKIALFTVWANLVCIWLKLTQMVNFCKFIFSQNFWNFHGVGVGVFSVDIFWNYPMWILTNSTILEADHWVRISGQARASWNSSHLFW